MTYFIVADVHGFATILQNSLKKAGFDKDNPNHTFISLGDLLDRGPDPMGCIRFVFSIPQERRILIRGNHEELIQAAINRGECLYHDYHNGTADTVAQLNYEFSNMALWNLYYDETRDFHEIGPNIFVHGWIPTGESDWKFTWREGDWSAAAWANGMAKWRDGFSLPDKTIFCGHWHTSWGHHYIDNTSPEWPNPRSTNPDHQHADFSPFVHPGIVALDACTALSHKINVYTLEA